VSSLVRALLLLFGLAGCEAGEGAAVVAPVPGALGEGKMPGPGRQARMTGDPVAANAECVACHVEIAEEWAGSLHHEAYTAREFQSALRREPMAFCEGCHAPEAGSARREPASAALGIACVTCHVPEGEAVLSALPPEAPMQAPHAVRRDPRFGGPAACAGCHEFEFPGVEGAQGGAPREWMQTTIREHQASSQRDTSCAGCHMPAASGWRSHRFAGSRDAGWLREVVVAEASRPSDDRAIIHMSLKPGSIGHALPTGDLLRRVRVEVRVDAPGGRRLRRYLARPWEGAPGGAGRTEREDDRLYPDEEARVLVFFLDPAEAGLPLRWSVYYERVEGSAGGEQDGTVAGAVLVAEGALPALAGGAGDRGRGAEARGWQRSGASVIQSRRTT
jgi:nitrate reductase cytochrome c-type subunit